MFAINMICNKYFISRITAGPGRLRGIAKFKEELFMVHARQCFLKRPDKKAVCLAEYSFAGAKL
jgi:hypothetical protein